MEEWGGENIGGEGARCEERERKCVMKGGRKGRGGEVNR